MRDSKQLFVIHAISRGDIAGELNFELECHGCSDFLSDCDDRLTDVICEQYAKDIGAIPEVISEEDRLEAEALAASKALVAMGLE